MSLAAGARLGPYAIVGSLGHGGMGEVYEARDTRLDRRVAIKTLRPELIADAQARRRFEREAKSLSSLSHPNICAIFDVGHHDGHDFIVMEYIEGETLSAALERRGLDEPALVRIATQIANALTEAHDHGVLHRDVKPQNVMIGQRGLVKVLDFGLARAVSENDSGGAGAAATTTGYSAPLDIVGTAAYMSPEQARGEPLDGRSDIFSLGTLLYSSIAGRSPFEAGSPMATLSAVLSTEPPPLGRIAPSTSPELQRIVRKCLEKDRSRRYQGVRDVATDLENLQQGSGDLAGARPLPDAGDAGGPVPAPTSRWKTAGILTAALLGVAAVTLTARWILVPKPALASVRSVAILPFKSLTAVSENYLGLGIADAVISRLSAGAADVMVRPTTAITKYEAQGSDPVQAGRELQVDVILDGTWQRDADRLRVSVNLLRVDSGTSLWTDRYDFAISDVFAIQDRVSDELVSRLRLEVDSATRARAGDRGGTSNPEAYDAFLRGKYHLSLRGYTPGLRDQSDKAISTLKRAVTLDPNYAEARAKLGFAYAHTAVFIDNDPSLVERTKQETRLAEQIRPDLGQVHLNRAVILWSWYEGWRIVDAIREYRLAEQLDPGLPDVELGAGYAHLGFVDDWRRVQELAIERDPTNRQTRVVYVNEHFLLNRPDEGLAAQKRLLGDDQPSYLYFLLKRQVAEAAPPLEALAAKTSGGLRIAELALLRSLQGRHREANEAITRALSLAVKNRTYHHLTYLLAQTKGVQNDPAETARWLKETIDWGMPCYPMFATDSFLDPVRQSPQVQKVLTDLKRDWDTYREALK